MFILTAFETLLFVSRTVLSPAHRGTGSKVVKCFMNKSIKSNDEIELSWRQKITSFCVWKEYLVFFQNKNKKMSLLRMLVKKPKEIWIRLNPINKLLLLQPKLRQTKILLRVFFPTQEESGN